MATCTVKVVKAIQNYNTWAQMTWWKTPFNMPVPYLFWSWWPDLPLWPFNFYWESLSWDLAWFFPWNEICGFFSFIKWDWPVSWNITVYQYWYKPDWTLIFTNWPYVINATVSSWYWSVWCTWMNTWVASWEVNVAWTYRLNTVVTWAFSWSWDTYVSFSNVPDCTQYPGREWAMWMSSWDLKYYVANQFQHSITGSAWWSVWADKAGSIWVWNDNFIYWVDENWTLRKTLWALKQFASSWSNWATWEVSGKEPWCIYLDNQFWWSHISYIWADWYKYLTWATQNPQALP